MSRTSVNVSTIAAPQSIPVTTAASQSIPVTTAVESRELKAFVRSASIEFGLTPEEVRRAAVESYGSLENAMQFKRESDATSKVALQQAFPNGAEYHIGRKPKPGEAVKYTKLRDGVMIRVWDGDLSSCRSYCLDFTNSKREHILAPNDVEIYSAASPYHPGGRLLSIEQSLDNAKSTLYSHSTRVDPNWETYVVREGAVLRITQQNHSDCILQMPIRTKPNDTTLVLKSWEA